MFKFLDKVSKTAVISLDSTTLALKSNQYAQSKLLKHIILYPVEKYAIK